MGNVASTPTFFTAPDDFRRWLDEHHASKSELWVGFYKNGSGRPSMTWPESVDEALCFGWIDGVRKRVDDISYVIRFTPRRPGSTWSVINVNRVGELASEGRMRPSGDHAFAERAEEKTGLYSYEQKSPAALDSAYERSFRENQAAWEHFQAQANWYRKAAIGWVMGAKREATRRNRLAALIEHANQGRTIPSLTRPSKSQ